MNNQIREQNIEAWMQKASGVMALQDNEWSTEQQYFGYIRRFLRFCFTRPKSDSSEKKFEDWLTQMVLVDDCSVSAQDVAFAAVVWFYKHVLKKPLQDVNALRATKPKTIRHAPPVEDVLRLLEDVRDVGNYPTSFIVRMLYGRGMRVGEPIALRVKDVDFAFDNIVLLPHNMWHETRTEKQAIWKVVGCRKRFELATRSKQMDLQMRLRFYEKRDDAKSCQRTVSRMRQGGLRASLKTWRQNESHAGICGLGLHEAKMPQSKGQEFQNMGRQMNQNPSRMDKRFREVFISCRIAAFVETLSGQNQKRRQLRAGQCSLGVANRSAKQQTEFKNNFPCWKNSICGPMVKRIGDSSERYFEKAESWVERNARFDRAITRTVLEANKIINAEAKSVPHPFELMSRRSSLVSVLPLQPARLEYHSA